jgi:hypothetical protein
MSDGEEIRRKVSTLLDELLQNPQMIRIMGAIDAAGGPGNTTRERADQIMKDLHDAELTPDETERLRRMRENP